MRSPTTRRSWIRGVRVSCSTTCSKRSSPSGRRPDAARSRQTIWTTRARCSRRPSTVSSSSCRMRKRGSKEPGFSDRRLRPGSARRCCEWRRSVPWPWSSGFWSTGSKARSRLPPPSGPRVVALRGKADRLDLLEDGTFRLIDYKLGWPPDRGRALQLPIYGICAEQRLTAERGRRWRLGEAAYLAFKGPRRVVPLFATGSQKDEVLAKAQQRLADTLDAIERGEFPPAPDDVHRCETCSFVVGVQEGLCRRPLSPACRSTTKRHHQVSSLKSQVSSLKLSSLDA